jgi:hypothetical protein
MTWAAHIIGAFYVFAGLVALRAMAMDRLFDVALAAITLGDPPDPNERIKSLWLTFGAALTLAGGVALLILSVLAPGLFVANLAVQTVYILWAERALPPEEPEDRIGRTRTINAALIYAAATVFVVWAMPGYARANLAIGPVPSLAVEFAIILLVTAGSYVYFFRKTRLRVRAEDVSSDGADYDDTDVGAGYEEDDGLDAAGRPKALRVEPAIGSSPICNDFTGRDIAIESLGISEELCARFRCWDETYQAAHSAEDYRERGFADAAAEEAFTAEGEALVEELRKEWGGTVVSNVRRQW